MRNLLFTAVVLVTATANAQVFKCPDSYPSADTALSMPAGLQGGARVQGSSLSMAYMYVGELYGEQYLVGPDVEHSNGKMDIQHGFRPEDKKWLVCVYGGNEWSGSKQHIIGPVELWQKLDAKITSCVLKVRKVKMSSDPQPWRATAECK
jgi:hypothetical protein